MSQYQSLFGYSGVEIRFTGAALDEICRKAAERGGGARGLRGIMVGHNPVHLASFRFMIILMPLGSSLVGTNVWSSVSHAPSLFPISAWVIINRGSEIRHVLITAEVVRGEKSPGYWKKGDGVAFWEAWASEEGNDNSSGLWFHSHVVLSNLADVSNRNIFHVL